MKLALQRLALLTGTVAVFYALVEFVVFPRLLPNFPLRLQQHLPRHLRFLSQPSKAGLVPQRYVLVAGDSYANGNGDWLSGHLQNAGLGNPPFHSTHVIHQKTGRDVVTFGQPGVGSIEGLVEVPVLRFEYLDRVQRFPLAPPDDVLVYFYEGNDLADNTMDINTRLAPACGAAAVYDDAVFGRFLTEVAIGNSAQYKKVTRRPSWQRRLVAGDTFFNALKSVFNELRGRSERKPKQRSTEFKINKALIGGKEVMLCDELQSPSLEMEPEEIRQTVWVFERSLAFLRARFSKARMGVLYAPSPLSCYQLASDTVSIQVYHGRASVWPKERVATHSDLICSLVRQAAERVGVAFLDPRANLRAAAKDKLIHGPRDRAHFSKEGYELLADNAIQLLKEMEKTGTPAQ